MASSSLEDLLAKEGFRGVEIVKSMSLQGSFKSEDSSRLAASTSHNPRNSRSSSEKIARIKSDIPANNSKPKNHRFKDAQLPEKEHTSTKFNRRRTPLDFRDPPSYNIHSFDRRRGEDDAEPTNHHSSRKSNAVDDSIIANKDNVAGFALDEVAVKAIIQILSGYLQRFIDDEDFRVSLSQNTLASLGSEKGPLHTDSKVMTNLKQAINTVERAAEAEESGLYELKKASLLLSVIAGANANNDSNKGLTSGIRNPSLSISAHLYLGVIYKIKKKHRMSAKHILRVFSDSPFIARTVLLPELWEFVFFPHLEHLKAWYNQEVDSLENSSSDYNMARKLKLLEKVYNEILDSGTSQLAVYYMDWLSDGAKAPSIPSVQIPIEHQEALSNHRYQNPWHVISTKNLYEQVESNKHDTVIVNSRNSPVIEDKTTLTYSSEAVKQTDVDNVRARVSFQADRVEAWGLHRTRSLGYIDNSYKGSGNMLHALPSAKLNELAIKNLSESVFKIHRNEKWRFDDAAPYPDTSKTKMRFPSTIFPEEFKCPLTGLLFDDPVTLETGQNFERTAIIERFEKGNKTCPVTGVALMCKAIPETNSILKRVVDSWKTEYSCKLFTFSVEVKDEAAGVSIIDQILNINGRKERITYVNHLISLGGLEFLVRRFEYGNLEEKTCVAGILCCCIEADPSCRVELAKNIRKFCFVELLKSNEVKSNEIAVLLLTELICLNRRKDVKLFVIGLQEEGLGMDIMLVYLRSCALELKPLVAVLLLHLDILQLAVQPKKYSIYREEAVDALIESLEYSLLNDKVCEKCCKAMLILRAQFSHSLDSALKQSRYLQQDKLPLIPLDTDDEDERRKWLMNLSISLLCGGKKSFLESISMCLGCDDYLDLVGVCLETLTWFSSSLPNSDLQLFAFSFLISPLKQCIVRDSLIQHKVLASTSLLNFSKIQGCRILLSTIAEEICDHLRCLGEVTWTANELLYSIIFHQDISKLGYIEYIE